VARRPALRRPAGRLPALTESRRFLRRPSRAVAIGMIVVAVLGGVFCIVEIVRTFAASFDGPSVDVPGTTTAHLDDGRWILYENVSVRRDEDPATDGPITIRPDDVEVTDSNGTQLGIADVTGAQTITRNGTFFVGAVEFHAPRTDDYTIRVRGESAEAFVARPLTDRFGRVALWLIPGFGCFVLLVVGIVFLALPPPGPKPVPLGVWSPALVGPQPGWYADPYSASNLRWWDGGRWTDQVRPR